MEDREVRGILIRRIIREKREYKKELENVEEKITKIMEKQQIYGLGALSFFITKRKRLENRIKECGAELESLGVINNAKS